MSAVQVCPLETATLLLLVVDYDTTQSSTSSKILGLVTRAQPSTRVLSTALSRLTITNVYTTTSKTVDYQTSTLSRQ